MQVVEGYQVGNTERQLMAPTLVAMASNLRVMASIQNRHQRCTSFLAPDVTLSVCGNGSFGTLRRCLGTTCHLSEVPALSLLGAPGLTTRNKDATRDSCVFFFYTTCHRCRFLFVVRLNAIGWTRFLFHVFHLRVSN